MGSGTRRGEPSSVSEQNAQIEKDWLKENQVPKGPRADRQEGEEASAVPQQDTQPENDRIKENQQLIPTEPKADRLAKTWQTGTRQTGTRPVPEQDTHIKNDRVKENQQSIPTEPKADRLAKSRQREIERDLYRHAARRAYHLLRPIQKHPRRESIEHPTPIYRRSRSPEEEREFNSSFPPLPSSPAANVGPPPGNQTPTSVPASARPARREACSTNPTERTFRKVSAASTSTPTGSTEGDDGNLYDPDKTEEEKEKIRQEINEHNRGLLDPPWSGPSLGSEMQDIQRG
ncbi:uncharacterized protein J4E78_010901 [Alternaria triticimaculans]|uniref:uncharacterized protein n=1 Tax=Alternaria triticimaculans TaxID=297637 RepID=UPI0020C59B4A|nr:uncharacterized protein J4E78_010901 [Alternaria triticimaculans]KAI4639574.1 hypothetical protein J4E78_010901 [Alternaria triticimaculans]